MRDGVGPQVGDVRLVDSCVEWMKAAELEGREPTVGTDEFELNSGSEGGVRRVATCPRKVDGVWSKVEGAFDRSLELTWRGRRGRETRRRSQKFK